jgi:hypothetical protein
LKEVHFFVPNGEDMTPLERINEMLRLAKTESRIFPATIFYNEGWLLRLVLDWFSRERTDKSTFDFLSGLRWFSEALLPSQFLARFRNDPLAEGWTHADGVVGDVLIGKSAFADTKLADEATHFVVTEAKLLSPLSPGVSKAKYFDQAARTVACMSEVLFRSQHRPEQFSSLGFFVLAPAEQVGRDVFSNDLTKDSIQKKVERRVSEYSSPELETKDQWRRDWFLPTLRQMKIECLCWEDIIASIQTKDARFGTDLSNFYADCLTFNRLQEPDQT